MEGGASAKGAAPAPEEPSNEQPAAGGSSNGEGGSPAAANESGGSRGVAQEGAEAANQEAAPPPAAPTNQEAAPQGLTNEEAAPPGPANERAALPQSANGRPGEGAEPSNESAAPSEPTNERPGGGAEPSNENAAPPAPPNGTSRRGAEPSNENTPPPAPTNEKPDPWDWASEGAWLRVRVGEGREGRWWGEGEEEWAWPEAEGAWPEAEGAWRLSPDSAFSKRVVRRGRGLAKPGRGSLCRVRVEAPPTCGGWAWPGAEPGSGGWGTVRVGEGAGRWAGLLDACLESMGEGEGAWLRPEGAGLKERAGLRVTLGRFTAPPFWWEEPVGGEGRWAEVRAWQEGAESFLRAGWTETAARAYSRALRLAIAAGGREATPPLLNPEVEGREEERREERRGEGRKAELHAGLALCQLRLNLPSPAATNAGRALALDPNHLEARYRRGLAAAAMRDLEAAAADLGRVLREEPGHPGARRELRRVRGEARERDARLARRLGRLFA